jgi:large subunit ribosomal protein L4
MLVDALSFDKPKTSEFLNVLKNLSLNSRKSLILIPERNDSLYLSSRNIQGANVQIASMVNTYDIMNSHQIVFVGNAHEMVTNILKK